MRLADDDRARVPFALVGVLLLVGSSTFAASLAAPDVGTVDRSTDVAMDRVDAETTAALRVAVREAARAAARDPVTTAGNTSAGRALGTNRTFENYLRLRVAVSARDALSSVEHRRSTTTANASLAPLSAVGAAGAMRNVSLSAVDGGRSLSVTVRNVSLVASRDGRVVAERTVSRRVTVAVPVLALHARTTDYQRRLNRSPVYAPGLARRTTAGLLAVTEARALAQHANAPIENVLGNRHVALSTNAGVLAAQRASFGRADPDAARGVRAATLRTGAEDLFSASGASGPATERLLAAAPTANPSPPPETMPTKTLTVGVNETADDAFLALLREHRDSPSLRSLFRIAYTPNVTVAADVTDSATGRKPAPDAPGPSWSLVRERADREVSAEATSGVESSPAVAEGSRVLETATRRVVVEHTVTRTWRGANRSQRTTTATWTDRHRVRVDVVGSLRSLPGPSRSVTPLFERGGALSGPNLAGVDRRASDELAARGGADAVARRAVEGRVDGRPERRLGERPDGLYPWVYEDVKTLREEVRNLSVEVTARDTATGNANAAAALAAVVRDRRRDLIDAPARYDGVSDRVRVAARSAYLDAVLARLDERAGETAGQNRRLETALDSRGVNATATRERLSTPLVRAETGRRNASDDAGFVPDGDPAYLSLSSVDGRAVDGVSDDASYTPLAARNTNLFTLPYGDLADSVVDGVLGSGGVPLRTAGRALMAANRTLAVRNDSTLRDRRDGLTPAVANSLRTVELTAVDVVESEAGRSDTAAEAAVDAGLARWDSHGERAVATANGSLAAAVAAEAAPNDATTHDRLETTLRVELREEAATDSVRVPRAAVNETASRTRTLATELADEAASRGADRVTGRVLNGTLGSVPAGLPLSPTLNPWVATTNLWVVEAHGAYARFAVSTGDDAVPTTYVRDGSVVRLDVDGDGERELVGSNERVGFELRTVVVAVVPPGGNGVGDVDGDAIETSSAWSGPAPGPRCDTPTGRCPGE
ncbi:DUF7286 family protein [Halogeometricum limi]|uniref:Uncharacterized protein n=1 Tax=Halogeometricum limi TaxID=555875 RepID=A0A1I6G6C7_9EURY|nr:hypothetical protein [Halogeometricum limi]SFR37746.1 hypothetical protein SAMN04488124_0938 [Halogeometricum limi]